MSFPSEAAMQAWLRARLQEVDGLGDLILNAEIAEPAADDPPQVRAIRDSFRYSLGPLWITEVITDDEDISLAEGEILRPDFVLYGVEGEALVIVELKNLPAPSRQAGTEASAYAGELRSHLPFLADGDVVNVIISAVWPTLLRHYVAHEILWVGRKVLCLEPVELWGLHALKIVDPKAFGDGVKAGVSAEELGGYALCLYDDELYRGGSRARLDPYVPQMRSTLQMMAAHGNALRSHGFGFLWKDHSSISLAPYCITMVHAAPFQGVGKFLLTLGPDQEPRPIQQRLMKLVREHDPGGQSLTLSKITNVAERSLEMVCNPQMEGFTHWGNLRSDMNTGRCKLIAFAGWGRFGERFAEKLISQFAAGDHEVALDNPSLGIEVVDELVTEEAPPHPAYLVYEEEEDEDDPGDYDPDDQIPF